MKNLNKSEKPKCKLLGEDGNIYNLMGIASRTLKKNGLEEEAKDLAFGLPFLIFLSV